jgi:hypothetical protein
MPEGRASAIHSGGTSVGRAAAFSVAALHRCAMARDIAPCRAVDSSESMVIGAF